MKDGMALSEKTFEAVACRLCGPSKTQLLARKGQFGWPTFVSICTNCGLVFLNPRWTKADYDLFYAQEYDQFYRYDEAEAAAKEQRKARLVWQRLSQVAQQPFQAALDIGCGLGWNLHHLGQQIPGLRIAGIEPSNACAEHFVNRIGGELIARDVDSDWQLANQARFDLITFRHVLEHLMDPLAALLKVSQALAPAGLLYIAVPDMLHPDGSLAEYWFRCVHTYYFSQTTLARLAARAGLRPLVLREEASELWGIFQHGNELPEPEAPSVYHAQMRSFNQYRRRRLARSLILLLSPRRLSRLVPKSAKQLIPVDWKKKFRHLVYRH
jgi:SAM-dependent methyltransferase